MMNQSLINFRRARLAYLALAASALVASAFVASGEAKASQKASVNAARFGRIQSVLIDRGKVTRVSVVPGLGSVLIFPCPVAEVFLGRESEVSVRISPTRQNNLLLNLKSSFSEPTNLVVRCDRTRNHFVFDLIPSQKLHQDILEIRAGFGGPELNSNQVAEIDSSAQRSSRNYGDHGSDQAQHRESRQSRKVISLKSPTLIEGSKQ